MNHRRTYEIAFVGLKPGIHEFNYEINDKFFAHYGEQDFSNCKADVKLQLEKHSSFMLSNLISVEQRMSTAIVVAIN